MLTLAAAGQSAEAEDQVECRPARRRRPDVMAVRRAARVEGGAPDAAGVGVSPRAMPSGLAAMSRAWPVAVAATAQPDGRVASANAAADTSDRTARPWLAAVHCATKSRHDWSDAAASGSRWASALFRGMLKAAVTANDAKPAAAPSQIHPPAGLATLRQATARTGARAAELHGRSRSLWIPCVGGPGPRGFGDGKRTSSRREPLCPPW